MEIKITGEDDNKLEENKFEIENEVKKLFENDYEEELDDEIDYDAEEDYVDDEYDDECDYDSFHNFCCCDEDDDECEDDCDCELCHKYGCCNGCDDEYHDDYEEEYSPKELLDILDDEFSDTIKERGREYYQNKNVLSLYKHDNVYAARVQGSKEYSVIIDTNEDITYDCSCPCDYPCKHVYATLLAINNLEYKEINLLPELEREEMELEDVIDKMDNHELKLYLINNIKENEIHFNQDDFNKYFYKYSKEQSYEYYYNRLHNALMFDNYDFIDDYLEEINMCLNAQKYKEAYKIFKSIIEVYFNLGYIDDYNFTRNIPVLKMYLKILCESNIRELYLYLTNIKNNNFYNNIYIKYLVSDIM